ncbi:MAG: 50S ribosomal protein L15 [Candidatus Omnitrophota bacterium]
MGLHNLRAPKGAHKRKKILGRGSGSGHGKTSTRGNKGQGSRAGRDFYPGFEGGQMPLIRKIPKRGFNSRNPVRYQTVNLDDLSRVTDNLITPEVLAKNRLIKHKDKPVKILGQGSINKPITVEVSAISAGAKAKIEQAGGKCSLH